MDGTGSETSKRQRLESYNVSHRLQQQPSIAHSHGFSVNTLPPPNTSYVPQPLPPSPYHESTAHEHRSLPEPAPHGYAQSPSGQNTPIRDTRPYPLDPSYSRRGSASASTRSPDGYQQFPTARPLNNAAGNDAQHFPQSYPIENAGHYSGYANTDGPMNGNPHHGLPMSTYGEQSHPNPSAHPSDYGPSSVNAVPHPYGGSTYGGPSNHQNMQRPKKGNRAQQACDICRTRKAKCDEGRPSCGFCVENNMGCNYQTVAPAKADRANQAIIDQLTAQNNEIHDLQKQFEARFDKIEHLLTNLSGVPTASGATKDGVKVKSDYLPAAAESESGESKQSMDHKITQSSKKRASIVEASPSGSHITVGTHSSGVDSVGANAAPDAPVAIEHTTAAHRLLRWPSIKALISKSKQTSSLNEDYVMNLEEKRGILRLYGKGEGLDGFDGAHPSSPTNSSTSGRSDEIPEARSPASSTDGLWGSGFADARFGGEIGGLNQDGTLTIDPPTLRRLLKSYMENIHILHPFLNKASLNQMFENFSAYYNDKHRHSSRVSSSVSGTAATLEGRVESFNTLHKPAKRKHSDGQYQNYGHEAGSPPTQPTSQPPLQKSISTGIILLVMALGKICECHDSLPGPVSESSKENAFTHPLSFSPFRPTGTTEPPSPVSVRQSPISSTQSLGNASIASPLSGFPSIRRMTDEHLPGAKNANVIPGLAYYAQATDILGNCHGGNDLAHVQANLLAGLYCGQLARTFESWSWISTACRACRYLVRDPSLKKEGDARADLIRFAFWTCSQLESDILAELDLPRSGIQDVTNVGYPKGFLEQADFGHMDDDDSTMMFYYSGQIHIRNVLNEIQSNLHPPENVENASRRTAVLRDGFYATLTRWRNILPPKLQWKDEEQPSAEINDARLRAKYYGAVYIVHRPFLRQVLDQEMGPLENQSPRSDSHPGTMAPPALARWGSDEKAMHDILQSAKICVGAAIQSTVAFDNIIERKRLIVTNIFGTAHAQFGNLIVLATTYKSKILHDLVPREKLEKLFDRTIRFLRQHRNISLTLNQDANILEMIREVVFKDDDQRGSFSSDF